MQADYRLRVAARAPVVVAPVDQVVDADADLLARAPGAEVGVRLGRLQLHGEEMGVGMVRHGGAAVIGWVGAVMKDVERVGNGRGGRVGGISGSGT